MTVQQEIAKELLTRLNGNSNGVSFNADLFVALDSGKFQSVEHPTFYQTQIKEYTPAMFDFTEKPLNVKDMDITEFTITIRFALSANGTYRQNEIDAIENFRKGLINNSLWSFLINDDTYNCKSSATGLTPFGNIEFRGGMPRVGMAMTVFIKSGIGIKFGDESIFELRKLNDSTYGDMTWLELNIFNKKQATSIDYNPKQTSSMVRSKGTPSKSMWQTQITLPYNNEYLIHQKLYDICTNNNDYDQVFQLRRTKPNTGVIQIEVSEGVYQDYINVGIQGTAIEDTGENIILSLTLTEV